MSASGEARKRIYFDHNATTYMRREVLDAMMPFFIDRFGNASSLHLFGQEAREAVEEAREKVAKLINSEPEEMYFTSGGTESDNLAIRGVLKARRDVNPPHVITSLIEHSAVLNTCKSLESDGVEVTYLNPDSNGVIRPELVRDAIKDNTVLISIMLANNETGVIQPVEEISAIAREKGITFHTDAVQGVGKIPVDVEKLGVDLLAMSAHKFYGPKGIGALYVRRGTKIEPVYTGGGHERGMRSGTENVPAIVGLGEAARISGEEISEEMVKLRALRDRLEDGVLEKIDDVIILGRDANRVPNTSSILVKGIEGEAITLNMSVKGFGLSSGSACSSDEPGPSHVITAMGVDPIYAQGSVRVSLGIANTEEDVELFLEIFPSVVEKLRKMSPLA